MRLSGARLKHLICSKDQVTSMELEEIGLANTNGAVGTVEVQKNAAQTHHTYNMQVHICIYDVYRSQQHK